MKQFVIRPRLNYLPTPSKAALLCSALTGVLWNAATAQAQTRVYPTDTVNIAAAANGGKIVEATSVFTEGDNEKSWSADNLIDGKVYDAGKNTGSMGWSSEKFDPVIPDSVTLSFAGNATKYIGKIVLNPTAAVPPERWAKDVEVQVSNETANGPYRTAAYISLRREAKPQTFLFLPTHAKYVRLVFRSNQGSDRAVAMGEVEIYEAIPTTDSLGQLIAGMEQAITELKQYRELEVQRKNGATAIAQSDGKFHPVFDGPNAPSQATLQLVSMAVRESAPTFPISTVNIAAAQNGGKVMNYSSLFSNDPNYAAKNLIDGQTYDPRTEKGSWGWSSEGFTPGREYVTLGFKDDRPRLVGKINLNPSTNQPLGRWARRVDVQVTSGSAKDGPWRTVNTLNMRVEPVNQEFLIRPVEAKYIRFVFQANGPSDVNLPGLVPGVNSDRAVALGEIEVYEATSTADVLDSVIGRFESILAGLVTLRRESATKAQATPKAPAAQVG